MKIANSSRKRSASSEDPLDELDQSWRLYQVVILDEHDKPVRIENPCCYREEAHRSCGSFNLRATCYSEVAIVRPVPRDIQRQLFRIDSDAFANGGIA